MKKSLKRKVVIKIKKYISKIVLFFLFRGFKVTYKYDDVVKKEVESWNDGFTASINTGLEDVNLIIKKENGKLVKLKKAENFEAIAEKSLNDGAIIVNPKQVSYNDVINILNEAF